jgi:hypothetical protein
LYIKFLDFARVWKPTSHRCRGSILESLG